MEFSFDDGGKAYVTFEGVGDEEVPVTADANEGIDRSLTLTFRTVDGKVQKAVNVLQVGLREVFAASDGDFTLADGGTFNVLK